LQRAIRLFQSGDPAGAERLLRKAVDKAPADFEALYYLGVLLLRGEQGEAAARYLARAARVRPGEPAAHNALGAALQQAGRAEAALESLSRAVALAPEAPDARANRAELLMAMGRSAEAADDWRAIVAAAPGADQARLRLAEAQLAAADAAGALATLDAALDLFPALTPAHALRAQALSRLDDDAQALAALDRAIALEPGEPAFHLDRAQTLLALGRPDAALAACDDALALGPDDPGALAAKGDLLRALERLEDAFACYNRALARDPGCAPALAGRAATFYDGGYLDRALADYDALAALLRDPDHLAELRGFVRRQTGDWSGLPGERRAIEAALARGGEIASAFAILSVSESEATNAAAARRMCASLPRAPAPPVVASKPSGKITLGWFSADFHDHATAHLLTRALELFDRDRFDMLGFSYGPARRDDWRARIAAACDAFIDVRELSDADVAALARARGVDVAIDLKGLTKGNRLGIFARRAAPVQASWLGFPGTTGADFMDYLVADRTVVTSMNRPAIAERVALLPGCYQPNDPGKRVADEVFTRAGVGLPDAGPVFCCFSNSYKILPEIFDAWMRILRRVPAASLWLLDDNAFARANFQGAAAARGVDPARLVFAPRLPLARHLARHRLADVCLDTRPYNAHTTASDALYMGVPVVTAPGATFASRVAASLVVAAGLPELVAADLSAYEESAVALAGAPERLAALRAHLLGAGRASPLFDAAARARDLGRALAEMHRRAAAGLAPEDFAV
jgi:predicted O-linked N-acetylglucosamine transferase (SPINDLY family)